MKKGFKLVYQEDLNEEEFIAAKEAFHWFIKESCEPRLFNAETKQFEILDVELPSWKHLTRGGHANGLPLQRGKWGMRLDFLARNKDIGKTLLFRRFGKTKRIFAVQRTETVDVQRVLPTPETGPDVTGKGCICNKCLGGRPGRSRLSIDRFKVYAIIGDING